MPHAIEPVTKLCTNCLLKQVEIAVAGGAPCAGRPSDTATSVIRRHNLARGTRVWDDAGADRPTLVEG